MDFEQKKQIAFSQGLVEAWLAKPVLPVPPQILEAFKFVSDGYETVSRELEKQREETGVRIQSLEMMSRMATEVGNSQAAVLRDQTTLDDLNNGVDEQPIRGGEFSGWNLVGGIRLGRPVAIMDESGAPMVKVSISTLMQNVQTDFEVFRLAVKRNPFGVLQAIVIDLTSTFG